MSWDKFGVGLHIGEGLGAAVVEPNGLHVETYGARVRLHEEVLLLVHGATCGSWFWERAMPFFANQGWDCVALNWRGHHKSAPMSDEDFVKVTLHDYVDDVDSVAREIGRPVIVIGHSIGGAVVLKYAEIGSVQPSAIILLAPAPSAGAGRYDWPSRSPSHLVPPLTAEEARTYFFYDIEPEMLQHYAGLFCPESPLAVLAGGRGLLDVAPYRVSGPMLVLGAQHDMMHGANSSLDWEVAQHFGADYVFLRGVGHLPLLERRWHETANAINRWLHRQFPEKVLNL